MRPKSILSNWLYVALRGYYAAGVSLHVGEAERAQGNIILEGDVEGDTLVLDDVGCDPYPFNTKKEVNGDYIIYDSLKVAYADTKDGHYPESVSARILCVSKEYERVEALCDSVESRISGAYIEELDNTVKLLSRSSDYDDAAKEYLEELLITVEL